MRLKQYYSGIYFASDLHTDESKPWKMTADSTKINVMPPCIYYLLLLSLLIYSIKSPSAAIFAYVTRSSPPRSSRARTLYPREAAQQSERGKKKKESRRAVNYSPGLSAACSGADFARARDSRLLADAAMMMGLCVYRDDAELPPALVASATARVHVERAYGGFVLGEDCYLEC